MGWIKTVGSWTVRTASSAAGIEHVKRGAGAVQGQWNRVTKRACPACSVGRLFPFKVVVDGDLKSFRGCNACDHYQDVGSDQNTLLQLRKMTQAKIVDMSEQDYETLIGRYQVGSRWCYGLSLLAFSYAFYLMFFDAVDVTFLNVSVIALFMFVQGMVSSYRCWQVKGRRFFVPGSFKEWLGAGQWLV